MFEDDTWVHVAITRNMATRTLKSYKNGLYTGKSKVWTSEYDPSVSSGYTLKIGAGYTGKFNGYMDESKIYNRVLTDSEIAAEYAKGS